MNSAGGPKIILSGMIWRFAERICAQLVTFAVSIVLARILMPEHYGVIAMTTVFVTICNVFVTSGFGMALIQKENADDLDFTTILVFGVSFSIALYALLFFAAPIVAGFYGEPVLVPVMRVMSLKLPLAAINSVQQAYVSRRMLFRKFFWATLIGTIVSAIVGIMMAYAGYGVWALVAQYLTNSIMDTIILGASLKWHPRIKFSNARLKNMLGFGWRILCSDLINTVYTELRNLIIGKKYSSEQLAYYNRGQQIPHLFVTNVGVAISSVLFPAMAHEQSDIGHLKQMVKRSSKVGTFVMFPIMAGLAVIAKPLVSILLTDKWLPAVPFLQMACVSYSFEPWSTANLQALKARGEAGVYLRLEVQKKSIAMLILICSVPFGVKALAASACLYSFIAIVLTSGKNKANIDYGFFEQLKDIMPNIVLTAMMAMCVFGISFLKLTVTYTLAIQVFVGMLVYVFLAAITKNENYYAAKKMIGDMLHLRG